jgi:hypothetical protein
MTRHRLEPVDIAAVSGLLATFFGGGLLFLSTQGGFRVTPEQQTIPQTETDITSLIEPEIGEAVLAASVIENKHSNEISRAARKLNTDTMTAEHLNASGNERVQHLMDETKGQEAHKTARIEFVKGRTIVNATLRAKRGQGLPNGQWDPFNRRMIATADNEGNKIDRAFRTTAPERFGTALENETQAHTAALQRSQQQAGAAVVQTSLVEEEYERDMASVQEQIGSLVSTATVADIL